MNLKVRWMTVPSVFSDQCIHPLDVLVRAWCRWPTRSAFIHYTCSSLLKVFHPLVDLLLMHGASSILCQHPATDFRRFNPLCPQKMHYSALFLDGEPYFYPRCSLPCGWTMECCTRLAAHHPLCTCGVACQRTISKYALTFWFTYVNLENAQNLTFSSMFSGATYRLLLFCVMCVPRMSSKIFQFMWHL
jgi:hypothetical protein